MTERIDEAESAGKKAQLLPASAPVRPLGSSPENLMGACYQTSPEGSARPNCWPQRIEREQARLARELVA